MRGQSGYCTLVLALVVARTGNADTAVGGVLSDSVTWDVSRSPYLVTEDVVVEESGSLMVEAGVVVKFQPGLGITVRGGKLNVKGNERQRVTMRSSDGGAAPLPRPSLRLVDGPAPWEGRVQVFYKDHWRSVCTNSRNDSLWSSWKTSWTVVDMSVACRQLGYTGGEYAGWYSWLNGTRRVLYQQPDCTGTESQLQKCRWKSRVMGAGVCDAHLDLAVRCRPVFSARVPLVRWRGIRFEWAAYKKSLTADNTLFEKFSQSKMQHLDIVHAGMGLQRQVHAAIESVGVPVQLYKVHVRGSAGGGINITQPGAMVNIGNCVIQQNAGIGIFINSSTGLARVDGCEVDRNGADGLRYVQHALQQDRLQRQDSLVDFCNSGAVARQIYPLTTLAQYGRDRQRTGGECKRVFTAPPGRVLTLTFLYMNSERTNSSQISVYDGATSDATQLATFTISNGTRPQSVVSVGQQLLVVFRPGNGSMVQALMSLTAGRHRAADLTVSHSRLTDNGGPGVAVHGLISLLHVDNTRVTGSGHVAGVHVAGGAGHVNVTRCVIRANSGDGINVTYVGGGVNVSGSEIAENTGRGVAFWLLEDVQEHAALHQSLVVANSRLVANLQQAVHFGNSCVSALLNVSGNVFERGVGHALHVQSCQLEPRGQLQLIVANNRFADNERLAINMAPVANLQGTIEHNRFTGHARATLRVYSGDDPRVEPFPVHLNITDNVFEHNSGHYVVNIGASQLASSARQRVLFTRNFVRHNSVHEPFRSLNPRNRVSAAVTVTSASTVVFRNIIVNPNSSYELGVWYEDQSVPLNCSHNWLGHKTGALVYRRIFDRKDRYNLARASFVPFLLSETDPDSVLLSLAREVQLEFGPDGRDEIGGEISGRVVLDRSQLYVTRDIYVQPDAQLTIPFGVKLNFQHGVGMMVAGHIHAEGSSLQEEKRITMTLQERTQRDNVSLAPVRLVGGRHEREGRLQVMLDNEWGTVCDHGWSIMNAALVCTQLGWVLNPLDWSLDRTELPSDGSDAKIIMSTVQCDSTDTDITRCRHESASELEASCTHQRDVLLRCSDVSWAGVRFALPSQKNILKHVWIEKAGLVDYATYTFGPALRMDFARHSLESVVLTGNSGDGLGIVYSDLYKIDDVNRLQGVESRQNRGHGLALNTLWLDVNDCLIEENGGSGIEFQPSVSRQLQLELVRWLQLSRQLRHVLTAESAAQQLQLHRDQPVYLTSERTGRRVDTTLRISTSLENVIGVQILNPGEQDTPDRVRIYDSSTVNSRVQNWRLERDLLAFPRTSSSNHITVHFYSETAAQGGLVVLLTAISREHAVGPVIADPLRSHIAPGRVPRIRIRSSIIRKNRRGITVYTYNSDRGSEQELYLRKANQSIELVDSEISGNRKQAVLVTSPRPASVLQNVSETTVIINRTTIVDNGAGIEQSSRDLWFSNNLFHWVMVNMTLRSCSTDGMLLRLPYVWQYDENRTHSVQLVGGRVEGNRQFAAAIEGHFARVQLLDTEWLDNSCAAGGGLLVVRGMEKQLLVERNVFSGNTGRFVVEFHADSQSGILGHVPAQFSKNVLNNNRHRERVGAKGEDHAEHQEGVTASHVIGVRGVQRVNITSNLMNANRMEYALLAGVRSSSLDTEVLATGNWWGTRDPQTIRQRIFDFDDWNSYATARFSPFLTENYLDGPEAHDYSDSQQLQKHEQHMGGRITGNVTLKYRSMPYIVSADVTVMPGAELRVEPGVVLEFVPGVGLLVLGRLVAVGNERRRITMRPLSGPTEQYRLARRNAVESQWERGRHAEEEREEDVRLCVSGNCTTGHRAGFLELYNATAQRWLPVCDARFSESGARVVCRQLQLGTADVHVRWGPRLELQQRPVAADTWQQHVTPPSRRCEGHERQLSACRLRLLMDDDSRCQSVSDGFVFVDCGVARRQKQLQRAWGGVRFSTPSYEQPAFYTGSDYRSGPPAGSVLRFVDVRGAGRLHDRPSPALLSVINTPDVRAVNVTDSLSDGITAVNPAHALRLMHVRSVGNLGIGVNTIMLTGEARSSGVSSFQPLDRVPVPFRLFGMLDICDAHKEIVVEERLLLYYKYEDQPVDCVKIFTSAARIKTFGFRLLQFNLRNATDQPAALSDHIRLYDGDLYNRTSIRMVQLGIDGATTDVRRLYTTDSSSLSVQLHATGGSHWHGFIAEIVTLPISAIGFSRDVQHNISFCDISDNDGGAVSYVNAGEISPTLTLQWNRLQNNGRVMYANFSTAQAAVLLDVQNTQHLYFQNNLVRYNVGGLRVRADSNGVATALKAFVNSNLFSDNRLHSTVYMEGRKTSPYQEAVFYHNYFTRANCTYTEVLHFKQVLANFTGNLVHNNIGYHIMKVAGFERVHLPNYQSFTDNGFYWNYATDVVDRTTILAGSAGQRYSNNVLVNPDNNYEMVTINRTKQELVISNNRYEVWKTPLDAKHNWWGYNRSLTIQARIKDKLDGNGLLRVDFSEYLMSNSSLLSDKCPPGWVLVDTTCFMYMPAHMNFTEAKQFCLEDNASMPYLRGDYGQLVRFIGSRQPDYSWQLDRVWVQHLDIVGGCSYFVQRRVLSGPCHLQLPFLCEMDPRVYADALSWMRDDVVIGVLGAGVAAVLFLLLLLSCWLLKSRQRHREKLQRRSSIRGSIRSTRSLASSFSDVTATSSLYQQRRQRPAHTTTHPMPSVGGAMAGSMGSSSVGSVSMKRSSFDPSQNAAGEFNSHFPSADVRVHQPGGRGPLDSPLMLMAGGSSFQGGGGVGYENQAFRSTFSSRGPSLAAFSADTEEVDLSGSDSTLELKRQLAAEDADSTGTAAESVGTAAGGPYRRSPDSDQLFHQGRSRSQPLETAM